MIKNKTIELIVNSFFNQNILLDQKINYSDEILYFLKENKILVRFCKLLEKNKIEIDKILKNEYKKEKLRIVKNIEMMRHISTSLIDYDQDFIFFKNFQHYPDMGDDIDIMILRNFKSIKNKLLKDFSFHERKQTIFNKLANKYMLIEKNKKLEIELHNSKLGRLSEFSFNINLEKLYQKNELSFNTPVKEFQLIINVIQRLYTRSYIRVSELLFLKLNTTDNFDREFAETIAKKLDVLKGLNLYFKVIDSLFIADKNHKITFSFDRLDKMIYLHNSLIYFKRSKIAPYIFLKQFKRN